MKSMNRGIARRVRLTLGRRPIAALAAIALLALAPLSAAAKPELSDSFAQLDPAVWYVTDTTHAPRGPMDNCPGPVSCVPANVSVAHSVLDLTVPAPTQTDGTYSNFQGGQIVSQATFDFGVFSSRFAAGSSQQAMNAMFLYNFATEDEIDIEVTFDGHDHDGCGVDGTASNRWEVWFTVWQGNGTGSTCVAHQEFPLSDASSFHDYTIDWQPTGIAFSVDHHQLWSAPPLDATGMHLVLNSFQPNWKLNGYQGPAPQTSTMRVTTARVTSGSPNHHRRHDGHVHDQQD